MAVSPEQNATLLQFLHHFKAQTSLFSVGFQHEPQYFAHTSAT